MVADGGKALGNACKKACAAVGDRAEVAMAWLGGWFDLGTSEEAEALVPEAYPEDGCLGRRQYVGALPEVPWSAWVAWPRG